MECCYKCGSYETIEKSHDSPYTPDDCIDIWIECETCGVILYE